MSDTIFCSSLARLVAATISSLSQIPNYFNSLQTAECGLYSSNSEIIREALRGMMERDRRLERLDTAIAKGIADAEEGRVQDIDEVWAELYERFAAGSEVEG
jgi:antitoxin ParD1/3/4